MAAPGNQAVMFALQAREAEAKANAKAKATAKAKAKATAKAKAKGKAKSTAPKASAAPKSTACKASAGGKKEAKKIHQSRPALPPPGSGTIWYLGGKIQCSHATDLRVFIRSSDRCDSILAIIDFHFM